MPTITRRTLVAAAAGAAGGAGTARAVPDRLSVVQSVDIARTPAQVWAIAGNFDSIATWHPVVASSPATKGNAVGSVRALTLKAPGDPGFDEELLRYDGEGRSYDYRIVAVDPAVLPVRDYTATFAAGPGPGGGCTIIWSASFLRGSDSDSPPAGMDDAGSKAAVTGVFRGGLDGIKAMAERAG